MQPKLLRQSVDRSFMFKTDFAKLWRSARDGDQAAGFCLWASSVVKSKFTNAGRNLEKKRVTRLKVRPSTGLPANVLQTLVSFVRPFELHGVLTDFFGLPRTNIANFAIGIVVPALTGNRIGNGFA